MKHLPSVILSWCSALTLLALVMVGSNARAESRKLYRLSLDELMNYEVTTVSRRPEQASKSAAAIFVITAEDIINSGAETLPEVLRMVPGLQVAQVSPSKWAISARGFNALFSNKLLVQIDGRSVYSPTFSGVYWDMQDLVLRDISRIEVIRGPGGALWGANAVSGIINIITKPASETVGGDLVLGGGNQIEGLVVGRYGMKLSDTSFARVSTKAFQQNDYQQESGGPSGDSWKRANLSYRLDLKEWDATSLTLQGDIAGGNQEARGAQGLDFSEREYDFAEVDILARLSHSHENGLSSVLQLYVDSLHRDDEFGEQDLLISDLEYNGRLSNLGGLDLVFGIKSRLIRDSLELAVPRFVNPQDRSVNFVSGFINAEVSASDSLKFILGTKLERNSYSGVEVQPTLRMLYLVSPKVTFWSAVSRAIRRPNRVTQDMELAVRALPTEDGGLPQLVTLRGNRDIESENLIAYESGLRLPLSSSVALDTSIFWHQLDDVVTTVEGNPYVVDAEAVFLPFDLENRLSASSYGVEVVIDYGVLSNLRLQGSYTFLQNDLKGDISSFGQPPGTQDNTSPEHSATARALFELTDKVDVSLFWRYVDRIDRGNIPAYNEFDTRVQFLLSDGVQLAVVGKNLLDSSHLEFVPSLSNALPTEVERSLSANIRLTF